MNERPISRFPVPALDALPDDVRARILEVQEKSGFVPNVFLALAHRPDAVNHRKADISPRQRAMLDFALKVCLDSQAIDDSDYAALRAQGFSDEDAWDIAAITALFALSNRMANATAMRPNDEFYLMGRVPRQKA